MTQRYGVYFWNMRNLAGSFPWGTNISISVCARTFGISYRLPRDVSQAPHHNCRVEAPLRSGRQYKFGIASWDSHVFSFHIYAALDFCLFGRRKCRQRRMDLDRLRALYLYREKVGCLCPGLATCPCCICIRPILNGVASSVAFR